MDMRKTHMIKKKERVWTVMVCLVLLISAICPMTVFAEENDNE